MSRRVGRCTNSRPGRDGSREPRDAITCSLIVSVARLQSGLLTTLFATPQLNFVFEIDSAFTFDPLAYFFRQGQRVRSLCVFAVRDDEVGMLLRNDRAAPALSLHSKIINHFPGSCGAAWSVLKKTTGGTSAVGLRRQTLTLCFLHSFNDCFAIIWMQHQACAEQQFAFTKGRMTIVPLHFVTADFHDAAVARDANCFDDRSDLLAVGSSVHPKRAADSSRY